MVQGAKKRTPLAAGSSNSYTFSMTSSGSTPSASASAQMKFRPPSQLESTLRRTNAKGPKLPLPDPESIPEVFSRVVLHACKQILFLDRKYRLTFYAVLLFLISLISDYFPTPKSYFSNSDNVPNQYFVKLSWAWTLTLTATFVYFTTKVTACGNRQIVGRHFSRLVVATLIWYIWTNLFAYIEESTGHCIFTKGSTPSTSTTTAKDTIIYSKSRKSCKTSGGKWTSFDISGHSFLLMWCVLFITEECKAIIGWDTIPHLIRNEEYKRKMQYDSMFVPSFEDGMYSETSLSHLNPDEFLELKTNFKKYNVWAKVSLILLTALTLLWDGMLIATACYFHVMVEKVIAGVLAVLVWLLTYKGLYKMDSLGISPGLPGSAYFKYCVGASGGSSTVGGKALGYGTMSSTITSSSTSSRLTRSTVLNKDSSDEVPKFLGMPLGPFMKPKDKTGREKAADKI